MTIKENRTNSFSKLVKYSIILSVIPAVYTAFFPSKIAFITMVCSYPLILFLIYFKNYTKNFDAIFYIRLFQIYTIILLFRGFIDAKSAEDWKVLFSSTIPLYLFIYFSIYLVANRQAFVTIFSTFFTYCIILSLVIFALRPLSFPLAISPIYIVILMMPYLSKKFKIFVLSLALVSFFSDLTNRSNLLNIAMAILISMTFIFKENNFVLLFIKYSRTIFLTLPIIFLALGLTGVFNVFSIGEAYSDLTIGTGDDNEQGVFVDSRTVVYTDVFKELKKENAILFGLGASGKTETILVENLNNTKFEDIYKEGRRGTESGMLNFFQWGGLIGGLLYFLLFVKASYYGMRKSKNWFCVMLGLWVAYKGLFSFIEDRLTFSIGSLFLMISIGICLNKNIRQMSDAEVKLMFQYIVRKTVLLRFLNFKKKRIFLATNT